MLEPLGVTSDGWVPAKNEGSLHLDLNPGDPTFQDSSGKHVTRYAIVGTDAYKYTVFFDVALIWTALALKVRLVCRFDLKGKEYEWSVFSRWLCRYGSTDFGPTNCRLFNGVVLNRCQIDSEFELVDRQEYLRMSHSCDLSKCESRSRSDILCNQE